MYNIKEIQQTCSACPSQWEGKTDKGEELYCRYRWGYLSVEINNKVIFGEQLGNDFHGIMDIDELIKYTKNVLNFEI
jgi:hypothetical protein